MGNIIFLFQKNLPKYIREIYKRRAFLMERVIENNATLLHWYKRECQRNRRGKTEIRSISETGA